MGLFGLTRKSKKPVIINEYYTYNTPTYNTSATATAIVSAPVQPSYQAQARLPSCRSCYSSQRTQLSVTQKGANVGREYYVCIGCPAEGSKGRTWIVWADQLVS